MQKFRGGTEETGLQRKRSGGKGQKATIRELLGK